jgi:uncharacterized 2Fe-2S/4Fe-4S cluster protein (DUF4445 family)
MPSIRFLPSGTTRECHVGQSVFEVGWKSDVGIQSACVGKGTCGLCRVVIESGEESLSKYNDIEEKHLGNLYHLTKLRLSCQAIVVEGAGDITVLVKPKKVRKKR